MDESTLQPPPNHSPRESFFKRWKIAIFCTLGIALLLLIQNIYITSRRDKDIQSKVVVSPTTALPSTTATPTFSNDKEIATYTSKNLGISFTYQRTNGNEEMFVKEEGNKICIYAYKDRICEGQFVEVFDKPATESLEEAIKKRFLSNKSANDCSVEPYVINDSTYPESYKTAEISFPFDWNSGDGMDLYWKKSEECSPNYAKTNGMRYFLEDTKHPTKFLFFSIGQYGINAEDDKLWQDTVKIITK